LDSYNVAIGSNPKKNFSGSLQRAECFADRGQRSSHQSSWFRSGYTVTHCHLDRRRRSLRLRGPWRHPVLVRRGGAEEEWRDPEKCSSTMLMQGILNQYFSIKSRQSAGCPILFVQKLRAFCSFKQKGWDSRNLALTRLTLANSASTSRQAGS